MMATIWGWAPLLLAAPFSPQQTTDPVPTAARVTPDAATGDTQRPPTRRRAVRPSDSAPSAITADTRRTPPPGIIGDWHKIRTRLNERGITVTARYASESAANVTGGRKTLFRETGQFDAGALFDLEKVFGLKGGAFQATLTYRRGRNLSDDANLGTLQQVQEVYGRGQTLRLTQFWYEQRIGERFELKLGRTNPGEDFAIFSCHFMNLSFCGAQPGNLVGDYWQNWPVSQWGARLRYEPRDDLYVQGAVYEINPRNLDNDFFIGHFKGATGVLVPAEIGWIRNPTVGKIGSYKLGGWIATADAPDVFLDINRRPIAITGLAPLERSSRYGVYINIQQQLTGATKDGKAENGLSVFLNATQADRATSVTDNQIAAGLFYKGLVPAVPGDVLGFGMARTHVNGRVADGQRLDPTRPAVQGSEYAAEVYYSVHPAEWLEMRPNVQFVHHPGGYSQANDVTILGLKAAFTL
ncbi:carbohydrate porin [uncultured Sphingomonas sp.]|uniref:carbohydrate porin n=1 Tax=uncultured Sphingomonas sp. TaxID=158754 RepID=UPI0025E9FC24|nr:carbohydrate porin [uncultured Sphingomonas sp.]